MAAEYVLISLGVIIIYCFNCFISAVEAPCIMHFPSCSFSCAEECETNLRKCKYNLNVERYSRFGLRFSSSFHLTLSLPLHWLFRNLKYESYCVSNAFELYKRNMLTKINKQRKKTHSKHTFENGLNGIKNQKHCFNYNLYMIYSNGFLFHSNCSGLSSSVLSRSAWNI